MPTYKYDNGTDDYDTSYVAEHPCRESTDNV